MLGSLTGENDPLSFNIQEYQLEIFTVGRLPSGRAFPGYMKNFLTLLFLASVSVRTLLEEEDTLRISTLTYDRKELSASV